MHKMADKNQNINNNKQFIITKKIAKHGSQAIIVIPKILQDQIKPRMLVKLTIDILEVGE